MEPVQDNQTNPSLVEITPASRTEITFFADLRSSSLQLIRDYCMFEQGKYPCLGSIQYSCHQKFVSCNCRKTCTDEIGRMQERFDSLPDWVYPFKTKWVPETFELKCQVNNGAMRTNVTTREKDVDMGRHALLTIQYMLKEWDLDLPLEFEPIPNMQGWNRLKQTTMQRIARLQGNIVELLAEGMTVHSRCGNIATEAKLFFKGGAAGGVAEKLYTFKVLWKEFGIPFYVAQNMPSNAIDALSAIVGAEAEAKQKAIEQARK